VIKLHFTNSNLREKHFATKKLIGKYQISKSSLLPPTPSDAHVPGLLNVWLRSKSVPGVRCGFTQRALVTVNKTRE